MDIPTLQSALPAYFAPWVQALGLRVESFAADSVTLRLPRGDQLSRTGGMLCGQAMMAAADTAMVLALIHHFGEFRAGKSLAFGEIDIRGANDGKSVCRATATYALL